MPVLLPTNIQHLLKKLQQCSAMQCNAMQCNAMQCNAMQCNAMLCCGGCNERKKGLGGGGRGADTHSSK